MSGSMSGVWKRSQVRTSEAPPDERGGKQICSGYSYRATSRLYQIERFPPPRVSARYRLREGTFAGPHGNGRNAPIPAVREAAREPLESTLTGSSSLTSPVPEDPMGVRIATGALPEWGC